MDQQPQTNVDEVATNGNTPASYALTTFHQPLALASVPPSSAGATFLPVQGAVAYPAAIRPPLSSQQPSQTYAIEGATDGDSAAAYALQAYHHQPVPLVSVPPSSDGVTFLPVPASQGAVAYPATIPPLLLNQQPSQAIEAVTDGDTPAAYALTTYHHQPVPLVSVPPSSAAGATFQPVPASQGGAAAYTAGIPPPLSNQHQAAFQKLQQQQHHQHEQLPAFWAGQLAEAEQATELKVHSLPLARIKKIMKADEDVKMIAAEAPVVFPKACEMFILELTLRAWLHTEGTKRRTLQGSDVTAAITRNEMFDFLMDVVPVEQNGDGAMVPPPSYGLGAAMSVPFQLYANQQPVSFTWPRPEYEQQQQQNSDGGQDE